METDLQYGSQLIHSATMAAADGHHLAASKKNVRMPFNPYFYSFFFFFFRGFPETSAMSTTLALVSASSSHASLR